MSKRRQTGTPTRKYERLSNTYDRRQGKNLPAQRILIVCEGAETEPNYFLALRNYLKLSMVEVTIEARGGAPISLVEKAEQITEQRNKEVRAQRISAGTFEEVWCVFDVENPNLNVTFSKAVREADERGYALAISNPSFEFWYILHFEQTTRPFANGSEAKDYLRRQHMPAYHEAMPVFSVLIGRTSQAIRHSKTILEKHPQVGQRFPNPSTSVHLLVEEIIAMSPSGREHFGVQPSG